MRDPIMEAAYNALAKRFAELVTINLHGEVLTKQGVMKFAACVPPKHRTPELAALFVKRGVAQSF